MYRLCPVNPMTQVQDSAWKLDADGRTVAGIPFDPANTDYQKYLEWLAEGNAPLGADEPLPPEEN